MYAYWFKVYNLTPIVFLYNVLTRTAFKFFEKLFAFTFESYDNTCKLSF